jgi:hypothetical protein
MTGGLGMNVGASVRTISQARDAGYDNGEIKQMTRSGKIECETCQNRKYQDGSDEMVSFKAPGHISPQASASAVMSHEQEHVSNAYDEASRKDGEVVQASVSLQTATCPECGRTYVSGGETTTQIKYHEDNPYAKGFKTADSSVVAGRNLSLEV